MSQQKAFISLDTDILAVRHATFVETRYCCVYVTEDNWSTLFQSTTASEAKAKALREGILRQAFYPTLVHSETLDAIELKWTGNR